MATLNMDLFRLGRSIIYGFPHDEYILTTQALEVWSEYIKENP